jgi:hypothetical protein
MLVDRDDLALAAVQAHSVEEAGHETVRPIIAWVSVWLST